ncbi:hypothetical protein RUND412_010370 [Rhizina undulata]
MNTLSALRRVLPVTNAPLTCVRTVSTSRRTTKMLRLHPHSSFKLDADSPSRTHIVYNPPSSSPSVFSTPSIFLPKHDPRKTILPETTTEDPSSRLPPPLKEPYEKKYHLTPEDFARMRSLRESDPKHWTRLRLAREFNCSSLFVGMVVQAKEGRLVQVKKEAEKVKEGWGERRRFARAERQKRRDIWGRDGY